MDPFDDKPLTKRQRYDHYYMMEAMRRFEWDMHHKIATHLRIPQDWHEISQRRERRKTKICFSVDEDVVKWFKSMGPGYQPRMNDVLRAFMHAKLSGLLHEDATIEPFRENWQSRQPMPDWGVTEREREERKRALGSEAGPSVVTKL
ncbi:BrnA antitoxin family protein [Rhodophyticola sp.]|jgi:uncharacterized protein (DUF4415 family)|uniref:BrnA antitoxin family protein n=1 Tax=Rhodophyticola sp. TaxID=2680032 RepID=UPI003D275D1A